MWSILGGILLIFWSLSTYFSGTFSPYWFYEIELGLLKIPISIVSFYIGVSMIINYKKIELEKKEFFSICPSCKEVFYHKNLLDGLCPSCNRKTIDIEKYYQDKRKNNNTKLINSDDKNNENE